LSIREFLSLIQDSKVNKMNENKRKLGTENHLEIVRRTESTASHCHCQDFQLLVNGFQHLQHLHLQVSQVGGKARVRAQEPWSGGNWS